MKQGLRHGTPLGLPPAVHPSRPPIPILLSPPPHGTHMGPGCLGSDSALLCLVMSPESRDLKLCAVSSSAMPSRHLEGAPGTQCGVHGGTLRAGCGWYFIKEIHGRCAGRWVVCCNHHAKDSTGCTGQSVLLLTPSGLFRLPPVDPVHGHTHPFPLRRRWSGIVGS